MGLQLQLFSQPKDLGGGVTVSRLLPSPQRQGVGPFLFMDHFGPITVKPGFVQEVAAHPHIGLATVTYLFEGALMHGDSLGTHQRIEPGAINWMTAGSGIVHSERAPQDMTTQRYVNHGIQLWVALPKQHEEVDPAFSHTPAADLPEVQVGHGQLDDVRVRVLVGEAFGAKSPVVTFTQTVYLDVRVAPGGSFELPALAPELGVYAIDNAVEVDGTAVAAGTLAVLEAGVACRISSVEGCRLMVLGGEPLDAPRYMWWNFVSSRKERIAHAAQEWSAHAFGYVVGDNKIMALPERRATKERRVKKRPADRRD